MVVRFTSARLIVSGVERRQENHVLNALGVFGKLEQVGELSGDGRLVVEYSNVRDAEDAMYDLGGELFGDQNIFITWAPGTDRDNFIKKGGQDPMSYTPAYRRIPRSPGTLDRKRSRSLDSSEAGVERMRGEIEGVEQRIGNPASGIDEPRSRRDDRDHVREREGDNKHPLPRDPQRERERDGEREPGRNRDPANERNHSRYRDPERTRDQDADRDYHSTFDRDRDRPRERDRNRDGRERTHEWEREPGTPPNPSETRRTPEHRSGKSR
uniref:RRM domain-containing protein n=1 Tax=Compsopogon caeruleus TaxID=31354 RepID=A0A7S1TEY3_9RHOD|mmetsp:Transcript_3156/g.5980  ORF Transcript_3156/g.5980 Transcript_3156/m.5980 type:complete len:269 (+) Transcript_3156:52-858(+)